MSRKSTALSIAAIFVLSCVAAYAQPKTEYSEKDKKKMAEIALRPEVKSRIDEQWAAVRRRDMVFAYNVNSSSSRSAEAISNNLEFREKYGQLYDNPILVRYVNSLGQRLVPDNSPNLYSIRLLLDPVPRAEALSTGTIYISTGLVSLLDNEAQLSYIVGHEIAHIERQHQYNSIRNSILEEEFDKEKEADAAKKRSFFSAMATVAGAGIGGAAGGMNGAMIGALSGVAAGSIVSHFAFRNRFEPTEWTTEFENEADEAGLKYMLDRNYDAREIPRLYARLDNMVARDGRIGLGFMGNPQRVKERTAKITGLLTGTYKADLDGKLKAGGLVGSSPEFSLLMASLKRDNGVVALEYDLYAMAKENLQDAVKLRSNDSRVHYYLGQVMALTGRTPEDKQQAIGYFTKAIQYDADRGAYPEPHLENALYLISQNDAASQEQIKKELKTYVALYQREHSGALPRNMHIIYDYFQLAGDNSWYVPPAMVVSTKNVDAIYVTPVETAPSNAVADLVTRAVSNDTRAELKPAALKTAAQPQ
ncbi:MAG: hypothetical protein JWN45_1801 [Acidobacteriaceae bacterium]|nr:hypothetical protein [Acidobacteriaceae bacterium]